MSMPATSTKTTKLATSLIDEYALLGWRAMLTEVNLSTFHCRVGWHFTLATVAF